MLCIDCHEREGKTPGTTRCNRCQNRHWNRLHPGRRFTHGFLGLRRSILKRDHFTCCHCGTKGASKTLDVHHLDGQGSQLPIAQQNNTPSNLVTLCKPCHGKADKARGAKRGNKLGISLLRGKWSYHYPNCRACHQTSRAHKANGLCSRCSELTRLEYKRQYYLNHYAPRLRLTRQNSIKKTRSLRRRLKHLSLGYLTAAA